jgi:peptidoglycan LD-endopeptidase CwlK
MACTDPARLVPELQPKFHELLRLAREAGLTVQVLETWRSFADHQKNLKKKTSWRARSLHCDGKAFDIGIPEYFPLPLWNPTGPKWKILGELGESIGLEWGGRWPGKKTDCPHFQLKEAK